MSVVMSGVNPLAGLTIGFIGSGVMGEAILAALLRQQVVKPENVIASDVQAARGAELTAQYAIRTTTDNLEVARAANILILSIKPQVLEKVLAELYGQTDHVPLIISIIAGAPIQRLADGLANPHIIRTMPNTPARIGQGMTVWTAASAVTELERTRAGIILRSFGKDVYVDSESYLDMATAISGSGPAYVFLFMESLVDVAVHIGFSRKVAEQLVYQTVRGSVEYAAASGEHLAELRNQVTSPGGTTADALHHFESGGLRTTIARGVWASYQRSVALGAGKPPKAGPPVRHPDDLPENI